MHNISTNISYFSLLLLYIGDKVGDQIKLTRFKGPEKHDTVIKNEQSINDYQGEERKSVVESDIVVQLYVPKK